MSVLDFTVKAQNLWEITSQQLAPYASLIITDIPKEQIDEISAQKISAVGASIFKVLNNLVQPHSKHLFLGMKGIHKIEGNALTLYNTEDDLKIVLFEDIVLDLAEKFKDILKDCSLVLDRKKCLIIKNLPKDFFIKLKQVTTNPKKILELLYEYFNPSVPKGYSLEIRGNFNVLETLEGTLMIYENPFPAKAEKPGFELLLRPKDIVCNPAERFKEMISSNSFNWEILPNQRLIWNGVPKDIIEKIAEFEKHLKDEPFSPLYEYMRTLLPEEYAVDVSGLKVVKALRDDSTELCLIGGDSGLRFVIEEFVLL